jgi:hypothetical protein
MLVFDAVFNRVNIEIEKPISMPRIVVMLPVILSAVLSKPTWSETLYITVLTNNENAIFVNRNIFLQVL